MKSNLRLTEKQREDLATYIDKRHASLLAVNQDRIDADRESWNAYDNSREGRAQEGTIYFHSNLAVPLTSLIVDHFSARTDDSVVGSRAFFRFDAQGPSMERPAQDFDRYFSWKLERRARTRRVYSKAIFSIYVQRKTFLKAVYDDRRSMWIDRDVRVLFDRQTDQPVELLGVGFVVEGREQFIPAQTPEGEPALVLESDPSFVLDPDRHEFRDYPQGIPMEQINYSGPRVVEVDYDRILVPDVYDLGDADCVIEEFDKPLEWVEARWVTRQGMSFKDFTNLLRKTATEKTDRDEAKGEEVEELEEDKENLDFDTDAVSVGLWEIWLRRDVDGSGYPQDVYVLYEPQTRTIVMWEYAAKMTPDGQFPYTQIQLGRRSLVETISQYQEYVDKQFNSQSYRNALIANPITGVDRTALVDEEEEFELAPGFSVDLKEGKTIADLLSHAVVPNTDGNTQALIDFVFGVVQLWLGVSNMAQGDYQALAPANTATGVEATLQEASKIGRMWMRDIIEGLEDNLERLVKIAIYTLDEEEVFEYMEGDVRAFGTIRPEELRSLDVRVTVLIAPQKGQRDLERNELALRIVERYLQYPAFMRPHVRPAMESMLRTLGIEDVDKYLPEEAPDMPTETPEEGEGSGRAEAAVQSMGNSNPSGENQYGE